MSTDNSRTTSNSKNETRTSPTLSTTPAHHKYDVIVIGAGASGLTAAYDLKRKGVNVVILEATDTLGGRLQKIEGFANDFPIDLGGEWIHKVGPNILDRIVNDKNNKNSKTRPPSQQIETMRHEIDIMRWNSKKSKWGKLTAWNLDSDWKFRGFSWHDFFRNFLGKPLEGCIQYNCVVNRIDYGTEDSSKEASLVTVTCENGHVYEGDQVIVTVPLAILKRNMIEFNPPLPKKKQEAFKDATVAPGLKVFLEFSEKFYHDGFIFDRDDYANDDYGDKFFYDECFGQRTKQHIMGIFIMGKPAKQYVKMDDSTIVNELLRELDEVYNGKATKTFIKSHVQNWSRKPFARGLYSNYLRGIAPMYEIAKPINKRLFFAGEHIPHDGYRYGYAHGAALSGRSAATAVASVRNGKRIPWNWRHDLLKPVAWQYA